MHALTGVLLLGPTGSGKSPLGDWLATHGLAGRRCRHFDFGAELRATQSPGGAPFLTGDDIARIGRLLATAALLEDAQFPIARRILESFAARNAMAAGDVIVLNGLPRHVGQAERLAGTVRMERVLVLRCDADTVHGRILRNTGGDRTGRRDDSLADIRRKLMLFAERTEPLVEHYRRHGVRVDEADVGLETRPEDLARRWFGG
jgi:adenylate kinase family enzyme